MQSYTEGGKKSKLLKKTKEECQPELGHVTLEDLKPLMRKAFVEHELDQKASAMATHLTKLFTAERFHGCNVHNVHPARRLGSS